MAAESDTTKPPAPSPCIRCGLPVTGKHEFFMGGASGRERVWMHTACMLERGQEFIDSGAADDLRIAISLPDEPTRITTGKRLREGKP